MQEVFVTKIHIDKVRHLQNINIHLSETERKHLILTGKNGSGKTSLLEAMRDKILSQQEDFSGNSNSGADIFYSKSIGTQGWPLADNIFAYISAERSKFAIPDAIETIEIQNKSKITNNACKEFLRYSISLDYQLLGAQNDKNKELERTLKKWFDSLLEVLREIYACNELKLNVDRKKLRMWIEMPGREPFGLHEMADGYAAFLDIFTELMMRFESNNAEVDYSKYAIVLIDEIETHLHVELQKRILPFLTKMFPNVQFVVSTHSPFVIISLSNAIVYDLEKREPLENPSFYSYESVVEAFLDTDMYSEALKHNFEHYERLCFKERTPEENEEFLKAKTELELMAPASKELFIAFRELEHKRKEAKNGKTY